MILCLISSKTHSLERFFKPLQIMLRSPCLLFDGRDGWGGGGAGLGSQNVCKEKMLVQRVSVH